MIIRMGCARGPHSYSIKGVPAGNRMLALPPTMPAARLSRRRKSSHALFTPAKPGVYGIPQRPVTFAPNVTPVTYVDTDDTGGDLSLDSEGGGSPTASLFPPSATPAPPPTRKRCPPGKRRSQGYIPRPPNAFMLFRADFVRQKHVPGSIETNHGSLSKIIGTCWRQLPLEEKRVWEVRAKHEKAAHKAQFPDYRFRPVHNKNKHLAAGANGAGAPAAGADETRRREKPPATLEDERRCEEVAQLLLEGKKGEELAQAVRHLDRARERELASLAASGPPSPGGPASPRPAQQPHLHMPLPVPGVSPGFFTSQQGMYPRRPSSVPLPNEFYAAYGYGGGIAMPTLPFLQSRGASPVASISRQGHHAFSAGGFGQHQQQFAYPFHQQQDFTYGADAFSADTTSNFSFTHPFASASARASFAFGPSTSSSTSTNNNNAFAPPSFSPGFAQGFGHPTLAQRTSLSFGLGRRASSAQPLLMRAWGAGVDADDVFTHPFSADHAALFGGPFCASFGVGGGEGSVGVQGERDHSPLPDVEPELFAPDFSFGGSSSSAHSSGSSAASSVGVPPGGMDGAVSPVSPVPVPPTVVPDAGAYEGSPLARGRAGHSHHGSLDGVYAGGGGEGGMYAEMYGDVRHLEGHAHHLDTQHLDVRTQHLDQHSQHLDPHTQHIDPHAQGMWASPPDALLGGKMGMGMELDHLVLGAQGELGLGMDGMYFDGGY
ncbi:hypothetical protein HYPSUDRAFT_485631 [Hypholoma sublateritium FD-334 SS-4]|uniref:HMG box domain-containing protein n=1 Tax=Hypholoma sublateritium (strain FD-334 SS-4) TaxID=945553 RepID=A0A0D2LSL5_HYPSF|nr:hypothetical protein HYPSUDRAFT_485631 [Hypholoma sublateritium FD-334 SS-4]